MSPTSDFSGRYPEHVGLSYKIIVRDKFSPKFSHENTKNGLRSPYPKERSLYPKERSPYPKERWFIQKKGPLIQKKCGLSKRKVPRDKALSKRKVVYPKERSPYLKQRPPYPKVRPPYPKERPPYPKERPPYAKEVEEYECAYRRFDTNKDGVISTAELGAMLRSIGLKPSKREEKEMIAEIDCNGDGIIDFCEFLKMMSRHSNPGVDPQQQLTEVFRLFDTDRSGYITHEELRSVMLSLGHPLSDKQLRSMIHQEPTESSKQPIRTRYLGHVTGYQPIRDQYFLIRSVPA
eukprot:sb/3467627/